MGKQDEADSKPRSVVADAATAVATSAGAEAVHQAAKLGDDVQRTVEQFKSCARSSREGFVFEDLHAGSLRIKAARFLRDDVRGGVTRNLGRPHDPADLRFRVGRTGETVGAQLKSGNAMRAAAKLSQPKYDGLQKVVPSNSVADVRKTASRGAVRPTASSQKLHYAKTAESVTATVRADGLESDPVSTEQLRSATECPAELKQSAAATELLRGVRNAAALGAVVGAVAATVDVLRRDDPMAASEQALHVAKAATAGAFDGTLKTVVAVGVKESAAAVGVELAGGAVGVIACAVVETARDVALTAQGKISGDELVGRTSTTAFKAGATYAGLSAGAALGTAVFPGAGTVVGAAVGSVAGALGGAVVLDLFAGLLGGAIIGFAAAPNAPPGLKELAAKIAEAHAKRSAR